MRRTLNTKDLIFFMKSILQYRNIYLKKNYADTRAAKAIKLSKKN